MLTTTNTLEVCPNRYVAEASTVGLRPGQWPTIITSKFDDCVNFILTKFERYQDELIAVRYESVQGDIIVTIYND
jgi:hypothetical protein